MILFIVLALAALSLSGEIQQCEPGNSTNPASVELRRELSSSYCSYRLKDSSSWQCPYFEHCRPESAQPVTPGIIADLQLPGCFHPSLQPVGPQSHQILAPAPQKPLTKKGLAGTKLCLWRGRSCWQMTMT
jgi:hypothetical protein